MNQDEREKRAKGRSTWPGRKMTLEEAARQELAKPVPSEQLFQVMWQMAVDAWALSGQEIPTYTRANTPGKVIRRG